MEKASSTVQRRRLAHIQPRAALATMLVLVVATSWWLAAQTTTKGVKPSTSSKRHRPFRLQDLPALVEAYGKAREEAAMSGQPMGGSSTIATRGAAQGELSGIPATKSGIGTRNFPLTEKDITAGTPSDEREPTYSPGGDFIAFASNGVDNKDATGKAGKDGKIDDYNKDGADGTPRYHLWLMNRDGTQQRQVTGLKDPDKKRDQRHPAWSPDGNQIVYVDSPINIGSIVSSELFVIKPFVDDDSATPGVQPTSEQRTFSPGEKRTPVWSPSGLSLVFSSNYYPRRNSGSSYDKLNAFDIFTISPSGNETTVLQLTGINPSDPDDVNNDPAGADVDDLNPAFSFVNQGVLYFTSNRINNRNNNRKRIWLMDANGRSKRQISDPTQRPAGRATDDDDWAAPSQTAAFFNLSFLTPNPTTTPISDFLERVAFQSNSFIDASDGTADLNVWSLQIDTSQFVPLPTPPPPAPPAMMAGSYTGNEVLQYDPETGAEKGVFVNTIIDDDTFPSIRLRNPEGLAFGPDGNLYVCNRNNGRGTVDRFDGITGAPLPIGGLSGATFAADDFLTNPAGICFGPDGNLYVSSGSDDFDDDFEFGESSTNRVHRFSGTTGQPLPAPNQFASIFTSGEFFGQNAFISDGIEGICFGPDITNDAYQDLYITALFDHKINVYNGRTGVWVKIIVPRLSGGLRFPTDVTFGPDRNGDGFGEMYVASSGTDSILMYDGNVSGPTGGAFLRAFVADNDGSLTGLDAPERIAFGPDSNGDGVPELFVTSFDESQRGNHVCRYDGRTGAPFPAVTFPDQSQAVFATGLNGAAGLAFNTSALVDPSATPTPVPTGSVLPIENKTGTQTSNPLTAVLESNCTSSRDGFGASRLDHGEAAEDKSADREPSFARSKSSSLNVAQMAFASQRRFAPAPGPDFTNPAPIVVNIYGGPQKFGATDPDNLPSHDIWVNGVQDFTPPILVPQGAGNVQFPVLAPGPQSPFRAPRTFEQGLVAGGTVTFGFVLKEQESGLSRVTLAFKDANAPRFRQEETNVNETIVLTVARELPPRTISNNLVCDFWDDGPEGSGGHERQAGAVPGDGIYYCQGTFPTNLNASDFYADINAEDRSHNSFSYDNIWGFTTKQFQKSNTESDLYVSDYGVGQEFPFWLSVIANGDIGSGDFRFFGMVPTESYWLTNPGGDLYLDQFTPPEIDPDYSSRKETFYNVDTWRVLCRGDVPSEVLDAYTPRLTQQLDPNERDADGKPGPFKELKRNVAVALNCVLWSSPYTGDVFAGPGTLYDAETQRRLTLLLNAGGRLFVAGREIIYSLSNDGGISNNFLNSELQAKYGGEHIANQVFITDGGFPLRKGLVSYSSEFNSPQFPDASPGPTFLDACENANTGAFGFDIIDPGNGGAGVTVIPAYTTAINGGGDVVGQKVERVRSNGIQSRLLFFSFGFEAVNRRYTQTTGYPRALDVRPLMADAMRNYFKTGAATGSVINDATNLPVPGFLLVINGPGGPYLVRTDQNGNFEANGLPSGGYTVEPAVFTVGGVTYPQNPGFFNTNQGWIFTVTGGQISGSFNFRVKPAPPGSLSGIAVSSNGTPTNTSDDTVLPNLSILVRSVSESSIFPGGGRFARLTTSDAGGRFSIDNIPSNTEVELVFNPRVEDIPPETGLSATYAGPNINVGRRVIPDTDRPGAIVVPVGDNFVVNDGSGDDVADSGVKIVVPLRHIVAGRVFINNIGAPAGDVAVTLVGAGVNRATKTVADGDDIGRYDFNDVPPGNYKVTATAGAGSNTKSASASIVVTTQADVNVPDLILTRQSILGFVRLNDKAASGMSVDLFRSTALQTPVGSPATTAVDGSYRFDGVDTGTYVVRATKSNAPTVTGQTLVTVTAGKDSVATVINLYARRVTGTIRLDTKPVGAATVELLRGGNPVASTISGSTGVYNFFDVIPGSYTVRATKSGDSATRAVTVINTADVSGADIALFTAGVSGKVIAGGVGAGNAVVQLIQGANALKSVVTNATTGAYSFSVVGPGTYTIKATKAGVSQQISVTLVRGQTLAAPDIVLPLQVISGRVVQKLSPSQPSVAFAGATVQLLAGDKLLRTTKSDAQGKYAFTDVPVGTYSVVAFSATDRAPAATASVRSGFNVAVPDLVLLLHNVSGRVLFNGVAGSGIEVSLLKGTTPVTGLKPSNPVLTGGDGSYLFNQVPAGTYVLSVSKTVASGQKATDQRTITVVRGQNLIVPDISIRTQTITGRVTMNGAAIKDAEVSLLKGTALVRPVVKSAADGTYRFESIIAGTYTLKALTTKDSVQLNIILTAGQDLQAPDLRLVTQTLTGKVQLGSVFVQNATVQLLKSGVATGIAGRTDSTGSYTLSDVPAGPFTVFAQLGEDQGTRDITVIRGVSQNVPTIVLGESPNPTPTATQAPDFVAGETYLISIPYADTSAAESITTVVKAFTVPAKAADGIENFKLTRYDAAARAYVPLGNGDTVRRGEGYFIKPLVDTVAIRRRDNSANSNVLYDQVNNRDITSFTVTLRNDPSVSSTDNSNGFNLIGVPFNPAHFSKAEWFNARVDAGTLGKFTSVRDAAAAGVMSAQLYEFDPKTHAYVAVQVMNKFKGYYVRTFVNGVKVTVTAIP